MDLKYTFHTPEEIFKNITFLKDFSMFEYLYLILATILVIIIVLYCLPLLYSIKETYLKNKERAKKKLILKKILLQKEVEDEILKEIKKQ